ncbi:MAG TPA: nitroreductase family deazaflavin-dependent oxidoreductase [Solirubrobacterales bacterium]|jgi:deazaflavin-dependent oxidoreductase (nitroreductase family)|nr:nitroreductase family deazaflavin-dependent oxidoreductase [Solirubrobacterales bacterium]
MSNPAQSRPTPRYLDIGDRVWPATRRFMGAHTFLYRRTGGRIGHTIPGVSGKMLLLDHVGAKSGTRRTSPLLYVRDGEDIVVVASKGGFPKHPAWFHNLKANPETTVQVGSHLLPVRARVATPEERQRLWEMAVKAYPGYENYAVRSKGREIPLVVLEPRS